MFTSGTTGLAKGVMISTGNVSSFLSAMQELYALSPQDRVSGRHGFSFDFSVLDMFITWLSGASLHVVPANQLVGPFPLHTRAKAHGLVLGAFSSSIYARYENAHAWCVPHLSSIRHFAASHFLLLQ